MRKWINTSYVIFILIITILSGQFVVNAQDETDSTVLEVLNDDKTKRFLKENEELLEALRVQNEVIGYSLEPYQEYPYLIEGPMEDRVGIFPQMIQLFEQLTQVKFQQVNVTGTKEDMMGSVGAGDIDLLLGLTMSEQIKDDLTSKYKKCKVTALEGDLFFDPFVLIGRIQEEEYSKETLPYYYWGCLEDQYVEIAQTELMNHTVTYNTYKELTAAYQEGTIQGMFITYGLERFITSFEQLEYTNIHEVSLKANKYYCVAKKDKVLDQLLAKMIGLYKSLYDEYFTKDILVLTDLQDGSEIWILRYLPMLGLGAFAIVFLTGSVLFIKRHRENKKMLQILNRIPGRFPKEQEVLFVFLKSSKIRSKHHFRVFGLEQKCSKKSLKMLELTKQIGFDFTKHYAYLVKKQEKEFTCSFELYIRGVAYTYEEVGIYQEDVIVSKIYQKEKRLK